MERVERGRTGLAALLLALAIGYGLTEGALLAQSAGTRMIAIATALLHLLPLS